MELAKDKPNFALLIGKKLDEKEGKAKDKPVMEMPEEAGEAELDSSEGDGMQDSAVADFMSALKEDNVPLAKIALKQLIELMQDEA